MLGLFIRHPGAHRYIRFGIKQRRKLIKAHRKIERGLFPNTATGDMLDRHGIQFGVSRRPGERDEVYRRRILRTIEEAHKNEQC